MIGRTQKKWVSGLVLATFALPYSTAHAYNNKTHQNIVNEAWQVTRAAVEPDILNKISWTGGGIPAGAKSLAEVGDCGLPATDPKNFCRRQVTQAEWDTFLRGLRTARQRLNKLKHDIPAAPFNDADCSTFIPLSTDLTVGGVSKPIADGHLDTSDGHCAERKESPQQGIFSKLGFTSRLPDDFKGSQGLVLGWHAEHRDDDKGDLWIDMMPILVGQILNKVGSVWEDVVAAIVAPFVCLWTWITGGDDCENKARKFADKTNLADVLKGILPGWKNDAASSEVGLWHFINVQDGNSNWYDDRQGQFYDEAGPHRKPSGVDQSILLAGDLLFLNLDASNSAGCERYEITEDETSFSHPSDDRADWSWQSETIGHVQFSPIDNFALYGHQLFEKSVASKKFGAEGLGWPLHAIGDVTVPMHVASTSGWGHRPWEDFIDRDWSALMFESCSQHEPGNCTANGSAAADGLRLAQLEQARRVLQRGFFWHEYLVSHPDTRDFITQLATETFQKVAQEPVSDYGPLGSVWCDACSAGYADAHSDGFEGTLKQATIDLYTEQGSDAAFDDPEGYYANDPRLFGVARELVERASGASLGYLLRIADLSANICTPLAAACTTNQECCGEEARCEAGVCARKPPSRCFETSECGTATCTGGHCCKGILTQVGCLSNDDCCGGTCSGSVCCAQDNQACIMDRDCCGGFCHGHVCSHGYPGQTCVTDANCIRGLCVSGICCGTDGASCATGQCCNGYSCNSDNNCVPSTPTPPNPPIK